MGGLGRAGGRAEGGSGRYVGAMLAEPATPIQLALGQDALDRRAELRRAGWADVPWPRRLVLVDQSGEVPVRAGSGGTRLATVDLPENGTAPATDLLLGVDDDGIALCGRVVARDDAPVGAEVTWAGLRQVGLRLPADERGIVAELLALANWHGTHTRCPRCGAGTTVAGLGWWRTCVEDGSEHYPRTDPAVIATLVDAGGNVLLGRQTRWPPGAFSTLAGFVEPGESAESAVVREIAEEVGLVPDRVRYVGSQPWPFPASLMLGFSAELDAVRPSPTVDGVEIAEARWLSRAELGPAAVAGEVRLPGRLSIAHHLIGRWYGADLPDEWCRW